MSEQPLLFIDIETHPIIMASWSGRSPEAQALWTLVDSHIMCFSAKWENQKKINIHALPDYKAYKKNPHSDKELCNELLRYLDRWPTPIVCAHNGDRFDLPFIKGRIWANAQKPLPPIRTIDTFKIVSQFRLDSRRLDSLGRQRGIGRKLEHTGKKLWQHCSEGDLNAWDKMKSYCVQDTRLLSEFYPTVAPWIKKWPGEFDGTECPVCHSDRLHRRGPVRRSKTVFQFVCLDCGHWPSGRIAEAGQCKGELVT